MAKQRKKRILLMGYYGFNNLGDEAVLESIVRRLRAVEPNCELWALSNAPAATNAAYGIRCFNRWSLPQLAKALLSCDVFVAGGGSLLQDATGSRGIKYYLYLLYAAKLLGKKVFLYAQGIGPIDDEKNRRLTARMLRKCDYITVRDKDAAEYMQGLGIEDSRLQLACDPVLALQSREYAPMLPMGLKMGFALRECKDLNISTLAQVADYFAQKGWTIVFLPFCSPNDVAVSKLVLSEMKQKAFIMQDEMLPRDMLAAIGACNFIVGIRLHSLIMAAANAVPFAALSYDPKIDGFCHSLGFSPAAKAQESSATAIIAGIEGALRQKSDIKTRLLQEREGWQQLAEANARLLIACAKGEEGRSIQQFMKQRG